MKIIGLPDSKIASKADKGKSNHHLIFERYTAKFLLKVLYLHHWLPPFAFDKAYKMMPFEMMILRTSGSVPISITTFTTGNAVTRIP
jgi:hypothetical protein